MKRHSNDSLVHLFRHFRSVLGPHCKVWWKEIGRSGVMEMTFWYLTSPKFTTTPYPHSSVVYTVPYIELTWKWPQSTAKNAETGASLAQRFIAVNGKDL